MLLTLSDVTHIDDALTQDDLDAYEHQIRELTNNKFHHKHIRARNLAFRDNQIISANELIGFKSGDTVEVFGTKFNDGLYVVQSLDSNTLTINQDLIDETATQAQVVKVDYPKDLKRGLLEIIKYKKKMANKIGIKSETIARKSTSYFDVNKGDNVEGIPSSYYSFLKKYKKLRW